MTPEIHDTMTAEQYRGARRALNLTQAALAEQLGLPREAIVRREAGTQRITAEAGIALRALRPRKSRSERA